MDVEWGVFHRFREKNPVFFWTENTFSFFLYKPYNDAWLRTRVDKSGGMVDYLWRQNNLINQTGSFHVNSISGINDENILKQILDAVSKNDHL